MEIIAITFFTLFLNIIVCMIFSMIKLANKDFKALSVNNYLIKFLGFFLITFNSFLFIPMIDLIIRAFFIFQKEPIGLRIAFQILNVLSLLFYLFLIFYCNRLFKLYMPTVNEAIWSSPNSNFVIYLGITSKIINPIILSSDKEGTYILALLIASFIIQIIYLVFILLFQSSYDSNICLIKSVNQVLVVLILKYSIIQNIFQDID